MSKEERIAIQNVVGGRQPKLIQLQAEETDEEAEDEGGEDCHTECGGREAAQADPAA